MKRSKAYYIATHGNKYRRGEIGQATQIIMVDPDDKDKWRPCVKIVWPDGDIDYSPLSELNETFIVGSLQDCEQHKTGGR